MTTTDRSSLFCFDQYFDEGVLSLHIKVGTKIRKKVGKPWSIELLSTDLECSQQFFDNLLRTLYQEVEQISASYREIDSTHHQVIQHGPYRVVITLSPLVDAGTMTVVRPVAFLHLDQYQLSNKVTDLLLHHARGVLIAGAPGSGKSTLAQALVEQFVAQGNIVKTLESPRDLVVPDEVVQYSFSYATHDQLRDILLLSRPDVTVYDEVRNESDFHLYKDLRLTGIGLIGVMHANRAIDAIQRFLGTIDLGMIGQVIDTVVFISAGGIQEILQLALVVKTPKGMKSWDLARPVIEVRSFLTDETLYEMYSYGEQVVVIPIDAIQETQTSGLSKFALQSLQKYFADKIRGKFDIELADDNTIDLYVSRKQKPAIIGKGGAKIMQIEEELGCRVNVVVR